MNVGGYLIFGIKLSVFLSKRPDGVPRPMIAADGKRQTKGSTDVFQAFPVLFTIAGSNNTRPRMMSSQLPLPVRLFSGSRWELVFGGNTLNS